MVPGRGGNKCLIGSLETEPDVEKASKLADVLSTSPAPLRPA